jgi:hypothetical protein
MTDFLKEALAQVPAFFLKFSRAFAQPRALGSDIKKATAKGTTAELNDAFIFLGICLLVTALCKSAIFREADVTATYLAKGALWKAVLVPGLAGVMRVSWRMLGGAASFEKYVVANCYYFGVFSVLAHIVLLIGNRAFGSIVRLPPATFLPFYATTIGPLLLWALYCWRAYHYPPKGGFSHLTRTGHITSRAVYSPVQLGF